MSTALLETPEIAFERLYEAHVRDVYRYALAVLRNPADAEDITQTTFMNAFRALKSGQEPVKPRPWLLAIAHNNCLMRFAYNSRRPREVPLDESAERIPVPDDERPNVQAVLDELGKLPFNQRSALAMRELAGRSYEEIAETLGVTVSAVETLLFRARRTLRGRRSALDAFGAVQLPVSLESFFGGGGAALSTGGALLGGVTVKVVAAVAAGIALGAAGYSAAGGSGGPQQQRPQPASPTSGVPTAVHGVSARASSRRFVSGPAPQMQETQQPSGAKQSASADGVASPATPAAAQATTVGASTSTGLIAQATTLQTPSVETPTVQTPTVQTPTIQTPSLPVTLPTLPTATLPTLPTTTVPQLP